MSGMTGLRIALVGPLPPPGGGMANQTQQLAGLLEQEGCVVTLVRTNEPYRPAWVAGVSGMRACARLLPYLGKLWRAAASVQIFHVMANSGWSWHLFAAPAIWIARLRGVPVVVNYRGGEADAFLARQARWVGVSLRRVNALAVPTGFLQAIFGRYGFAAQVLPNIVDVARFTPRSRAMQVSNAAPHVIVTRNLEAIYDCATAIRAFAKLLEDFPDATLSVAGAGPQRAELEALTSSLGIAARVHFTGSLDQTGMAALYASADVMLNASRVDNTPNSILEALASGVPVVSTRVGGIPYVVEDRKTALLVEPGDANAMAHALVAILRDRALADRLVASGLESVQQYAWPRVKHVLFDLYRRQLASPPAEAKTA